MFRASIALMVLLLTVPLPLISALGRGEDVVIEAEEEDKFAGLVKPEYSSWEQGKPGGRFVLSRFGSDPKTFNNIVSAESSTSDVVDRLYSSAVRRNQLSLDWEPGLARRYEVSADQKSVTFFLRRDLEWSDGQPLTAEDFVYTVNTILYDENVETNMRDSLFVGGEPSKWELIDEHTYKVVLPHVYAGIFNLSSVQPAPKHIFEPLIEKSGAAAVNSFWGVDTDVTSVVGCGPFVIAEYVPSQKVVLKRNPLYYEKDEWGQQLPYLDEVVYLLVENQDTQLVKFLAGELDYYGLRGEDHAILIDKRDELNFEIYTAGPVASTQFITFNQNPKEGEDDNGLTGPKLEWLSNLQFRRAMAHLVDRETIINNIAYGFGYPQYGFVPIWSPYYWDGVADYALEFDPERAKQLLDEISFTDRDGDGWREDASGNKISLVLNTNSGNRVREAIGEMFSQEARKVGIEITFKPEDFNAMVTKLVNTYDWELILIGLTGSVDPISGANVYPSRGNLHMNEPKQTSPRRDWEKQVDAAWDEANLTTDEAQRKRGFEKIQRLWIEAVPWVYTFNAASMGAYRRKFGNIKPHPITGYGWDGLLTRMYIW